MKKAINRIFSLALTLLLLVGAVPFAVAADHPLWDGTAKTVTMKAGEEQRYIYVPAADGPYTISQSTSVIQVSFEQADFTDKDAEPIPVHVEGKANANDECYRLKGGVRYIVRFSMSSIFTEWPDGLTDTISIYAGEPKKEVDLCDPITTGSHKMTIKPGEERKYKFTPDTSGRYVLYGANTIINVRLRCGTESLDMPENRLFIANPFGKAFGYYADMTAGETYVVTFSMWEMEPYPNGFTDTYHLEKVDGMKQAPELRAAVDHQATTLHGYVGGHIQLFPYTDPIYYEAFTTAWTVSDPSVAQFITEDSQQTRELELKKAGTVTVTATVDGRTVSQTITVKDRPVLELNKTVRLTFGGTTGVQCAFTPAESGTYRFVMKGPGGTTTIQDTNYGTYWEGSGSLSASLKAGKTYILEGAFGPADYTVTVTKGGGSAGTTNPAPPSGDEPTTTTSVAPTETKPVDKPTDTATTGKKPVHKVPVHKENGKAQVNYEDVAHLLEGDNDALTVEVEDEQMTAVTLPIRVLSEAAESNTTLRVEWPYATVTLDVDVLAHVAGQVTGESVELSVERVERNTLSEQQQNQLKNKEVAAVVRLSLMGDEEIHALGGTVAVTIPFIPEGGKRLSDYTVYYVAEDGQLEKMKTVVADDGLTFLTTHFSDYTIVYEFQKGDPPPLGRTMVVWALVALLIIGGGAVAAILLTKKRK